MNLVSLALAYVRHRLLVTALTVSSIALGAALILVILGVRREVERAFLEQSQRYDLIVGAHGSETALVLNALFHADLPRGNIPLESYLGIKGQAGVIAAFPFNLGDRYRRSRIVGTTRDFLEQRSPTDSDLFPLAEGRLFERDFELVVGAEAARRYGLKVGDEIVGSHGMAHREVDDEEGHVEHGEHEHAHEADEHGHGEDKHDEEVHAADEHHEFPYEVVGVLAPTGSAHDRAMFATLDSYWKIHEPAGASADQPEAPREVTVVLVRTSRPLLLQLQRLLPRKYSVMAVRPAEVFRRRDSGRFASGNRQDRRRVSLQPRRSGRRGDAGQGVARRRGRGRGADRRR